MIKLHITSWLRKAILHEGLSNRKFFMQYPLQKAILHDQLSNRTFYILAYLSDTMHEMLSASKVYMEG